MVFGLRDDDGDSMMRVSMWSSQLVYTNGNLHDECGVRDIDKGVIGVSYNVNDQIGVVNDNLLLWWWKCCRQ